MHIMSTLTWVCWPRNAGKLCACQHGAPARSSYNAIDMWLIDTGKQHAVTSTCHQIDDMEEPTAVKD